MANRHLLASLLVLTVLAVGTTFYKFYIARDYLVVAVMECDPEEAVCFIGDGEYTPEFYRVVSKPAYTIPACDAWAGECEPLTCTPEESLCQEAVCDSSMGDECSSGVTL